MEKEIEDILHPLLSKYSHFPDIFAEKIIKLIEDNGYKIVKVNSNPNP